MSSYSQIVWKVLSGIPVEVFDDETNSVWSSELWELVNVRESGDFAGKRTIGSANVISAYNLLHLKLIAEFQDDVDSLAKFTEVMNELVEQKLIRKQPGRVRQTFKTV